jgi:hypothetical protein
LAIRFDFDQRLTLQFHGSVMISDAESDTLVGELPNGGPVANVKDGWSGRATARLSGTGANGVMLMLGGGEVGG